MIKVTWVTWYGQTERESFPKAVTYSKEPDGQGGCLIVLRDADDAMVASFPIDRILGILSGPQGE